MIIRKLVATTILAIASTGIATVLANGQAEVANDFSVSAADGPVAYTTTLAADHSSAMVNLASGRFVVGPDAVAVTADNGSVVGSIPMTLRTEAGQSLAVAPQLDSTGTVLTLTPVSAPTPAAANSQVGPALHQVAGGGAIFAGIVIGCVIGILIGIWFFLVGAIFGCVIGAFIGGFIAASL